MVSIFKKFGEAVEEYLRRLNNEDRELVPDEAELVRRRIEEQNAFLALISSKITGTSVTEMPPLQCDPSANHHPDCVWQIRVSKSTYRPLAKHVGISLNSMSHWALCVIDRGFGVSYCYDFMSDQMALNMLRKNYFRVGEIKPESSFIESWGTCYYIGETTKSNDNIQEVGYRHMADNPRYHLLNANCQDLAEDLVKEVCDGRAISQAKVGEELCLVSPRIAFDLMVARVQSKITTKREKEDSEDVKEDVDVIKGLHRTMTEREQGL